MQSTGLGNFSNQILPATELSILSRACSHLSHEGQILEHVNSQQWLLRYKALWGVCTSVPQSTQPL